MSGYGDSHPLLLVPGAEADKGRLIVKEDQETGSVDSRIYFYYFKSMNYWVTLGILVTVAARAGTQIGSNFLLADWSEISVTTNDTEVDKPLGLSMYMVCV